MIELHHNGIKATIDPHGAWLTNLADEHGDILFPKRSFQLERETIKVRGGCHVCLPNFGPGGESDQPQHGFAREVRWNVEDTGDNYALLALKEGRGEYKELSATLSYIIEDASIEVILEVINNSEHDQLHIAPGFHPYFALVQGESEVNIGGEKVTLKSLCDVQFTIAEKKELITKHRRISISAENLDVWGQWTDQLGAYVCVEPTQAGFAFLKPTPDEEELLGPGEQKKYSMTVSWAKLEK